MIKKKTITLAIFATVLLGLFGLYKYEHVSGTWRYRITVEIETPEGVKTGSAVREVSNSASRHKMFDLPEAGNPPSFKGEAVVVDLGKRGVVFAMPGHEFFDAFPRSGSSTFYGIKYYNEIPIAKTVRLLPQDYPQFVTFEDMSDPKSVTLVRGGKFNPKTQKHDPVDNFEALFGQGVKIKEISIERTDEPVTWELDAILTKDFWNKRRNWLESMSIVERSQYGKNNLFKFRKDGVRDNEF